MTLKKKLLSEEFFAFYIMSLMILIPVGEFISELFGDQFYNQLIIVAVYGIAGIITAVLFFLEKAKSPLFYPTDIFYVTLIFFAAVSLVFTKNILAGTGGYGEWLIHYVAYFSLMFAGTMIESAALKKRILFTFAAVALFNCIVSIPQSFGLRIMDCMASTEYHNLMDAVFGLTQNCNFFAGLCTLFIGAAAGVFIFAEKKSVKWLSLALYTLCFYCYIATTTRIAWLGTIALLTFYVISFIVMKIKKHSGDKLKSYWTRWGAVTLISAIIFVYFAVFTNAMELSIAETVTDINVSSADGIDFDEFGSQRGYIWKYAFEAVPKYWLTGVGLDNFYYAFISNPNWDEVHASSRAHNEYIHTLVTQGVFAAVNYIAMLVYACVVGVRTVINTEDEEKRKLTWIFLGMFAGYAAQALVNSSIVNVAPYFWITLGMVMPKSEQKVLKRRKRTA